MAETQKVLKERSVAFAISRIDGDQSDIATDLKIPVASHFILAAGVLTGKRLLEQSPYEMRAAIAVNLVNVMRICETILQRQARANIVVIGSQSAALGSFDELYSVTKAAVNTYVAYRDLGNEQLMACVNPPIISDSGMTRRRDDYPEVLNNRITVTAREVAERVCDLLLLQPWSLEFKAEKNRGFMLWNKNSMW